ncbi:MAG: PilZ domain-containing protein [Nitrospirota bacterium]
MEKRSVKRIPVCLDFKCCGIEFLGTITNLSEKGMFFISKKITFPLQNQFQISIQLNGKKLNLPVKIKRVTKTNGYYDGIGIEILEQPLKYLELVHWLRFAFENRN